MTFRIALISDLHVGQGARCEDLYVAPENDVTAGRPVLDKNFLSSFSTVAASLRADHGEIDFLCVTGDITNEARPEEFRHASSAILKIAASLGLCEDQILFVPGNHDVNWPILQLGSDSLYRTMRYAPIQEGHLFKTRNDQLLSGGNLFDEPYCGIWDLARVTVIAFNTAEHDGPKPIEGEHYGRISLSAFDHAHAYLSHADTPNDKLRVCLIHHHPKLYQEVREHWPDFSALSNAENLLKLLDEFRFDLVVHGHRHFPNVSTSAGDNAHPVTIIGCGSFSARLDSKWFGSVTNHFHIVDVDRVSDVAQGARSQGYVRSWSYDLKKRGWFASHERTGIRHIRPFGAHAAYGALLASTTRAVVACMKVSTACEVRELFEYEAALQYAVPEQLHRALGEVCRSLSLRLKGDLDSAVSEWALLPGKVHS